MTDVNEAFTIERARQMANADDQAQWLRDEVAAGRARDMGNGLFRITEGYDRGETVRLTESGEIMAQHGLDMTGGKAAFYSRVPFWHELGNIVPEGVVDIDEVMRLGGLDHLIEKRPDTYRNPVTGAEEIMDGSFKTFRMDTGKALGTVGNVFEVFQNRASFEFLEMLVGRHGFVWDSAGALRDGARTFVTLRMPDDIFIDPDGINDRIIPFISGLNSHSGSSKFEVIATPWRIGCGNTERFGLRDALVRWGTRHTPNMHDKVADAQKTLANTIKYFEQFVEEETALAQTHFGDAELEKLVDEIWGEVDAEAKQSTKTKRGILVGKLKEIHTGNVQELGRTAYAAERTITQWADHERKYRPRLESLKGKDALIRATAVMEDLSGDLKSKAHRQLLLRTNR